MKVLITGAMGWLGTALTEGISRDHEVRAFDLEDPEAPRGEVDFDGEVVYGSVTDFDAVREAVRGVDGVVHAAVASTVARGLYQPGDAVPFDVNVRGTYNLLEAARQEGVRRVVLIAAAETHVDHPRGRFVDRDTPYVGAGSIYDLTKRLQEETARWFCALWDVDVIALRLGDIVDAQAGRAKREAQWQESLATASWVDRHDVAEACVSALALDHSGFDVFHLVGAPEQRRRFDVARAEAVLGITFRVPESGAPERGA